MKIQSDTSDLLKQPGMFRRNQLSAAVALGAMMMTSNVAAQPVLEEVVVTATRRAQAVQDVPYSISVLSSQTIDDTGVSDLSDMVNLIPGLVSAEMGADAGVNNTLIMRGVNANNPGTNNILPNVVEPSVSTYLNNSPVFLNLKLADISRVEVLRGPQGTLYGSGSVGGTVRFIFNEPDTETATASLSAGVSSSAHSDDLGYEVDFVGNLPLAENLAVRISAG
ncbi:MAG: TonB-dependent receptor, partial [Gammaproteobacteria bacterium]|nr:TonB-dependent receptor [Gammaproteobacteria bacterium]